MRACKETYALLNKKRKYSGNYPNTPNMNYFVSHFIELKKIIPTLIAYGETGRVGLEYQTIKVYKYYLPGTIACDDKKFCHVFSISSKKNIYETNFLSSIHWITILELEREVLNKFI